MLKSKNDSILKSIDHDKDFENGSNILTKIENEVSISK